MQSYLQLDFVQAGASTDLLLADLSDFAFEGFEELDNGQLRAFIPLEAYDDELDAYCQELQAEGWTIIREELAPKNWNEVWETAYEPVEVDDFCRIRADFHPSKSGFRYELAITPKMSFGTGHHATTRLVLRLMRDAQSWDGKKVLDFGCGTGVLGIVAAKLGASQVEGLDIEPWACENTVENAQANGVNMQVYEPGGLEQLTDNQQYEVILANINRHILLSEMPQMRQHLKPQGLLFLSGFYERDVPAVQAAAQAAGLVLDKVMGEAEGEGEWRALQFHLA